MHKFLTLCLHSQAVSHGAVEEHLAEYLSEQWRIKTVTPLGDSSTSKGSIFWVGIVLEEVVEQAPTYPMTHATNVLSQPLVPPSNLRVDSKTPLEIGTQVFAFSHGTWWPAEVIGLEARGRVRVSYPGWDSSWDETLARKNLRLDAESREP